MGSGHEMAGAEGTPWRWSPGIGPGPRADVDVLDWDAARGARCAAIVRELGAVAHVHTAALKASRGRLTAPISVVALGSAASARCVDDQTLRALAGRSETVIGYERGLDGWPLAVRCQLLVAGVESLLDASDPVFESLLTSRLQRDLERVRGLRQRDAELEREMAQQGMIGASRPMLELFRTAHRVSLFSDIPVLISGETGTGKELLARAVHRLDPKRCAGPFVPVNCGAINAELADSELFGHRRGAYTGSVSSRAGLIRSADGGALFLDEIGELDLSVQVKLLRVLQEGCVLGVGEDREAPVDVRIIAATNRDLGAMVEEGTFRRDLYHRLNVARLDLPPLREHAEDVPALLVHFVHKHGRAGRRLPTASRDCLEALQAMEFPGNIRELENMVRRIVVDHDAAEPIRLSDLPREALRELLRQRPLEEPAAALPVVLAGTGAPALEVTLEAVEDPVDLNLSRRMADFERRVVAAALARSAGNQTQAARLLGVTTRSVYNKIRKHGITV